MLCFVCFVCAVGQRTLACEAAGARGYRLDRVAGTAEHLDVARIKGCATIAQLGDVVAEDTNGAALIAGAAALLATSPALLDELGHQGAPRGAEVEWIGPLGCRGDRAGVARSYAKRVSFDRLFDDFVTPGKLTYRSVSLSPLSSTFPHRGSVIVLI